MATLPPTSMLSRTRSNRMPGGKSATAADSESVINLHAGAATSTLASQIPTPTTHVSVFLTNLRLLDLDLRPDWPGITSRTFTVKDATQGQKRRIQSVEWALYHLFSLWDPEEVRRKMQMYFPPADQVQSVNLRNALLRALEQAKKNGALGRDAILRKTMLDECRGERLEEILAVFSSAVLKKVVAEEVMQPRSLSGSVAVARRLALENRGYSAERTQLNSLILAHRASLTKMIREKEVARARYEDFAELLALRERSTARKRELAKALQKQEQAADNPDAAAAVSDDAKLHLRRLVRNNWAGSDQWMETLLYGDDRTHRDGLLSTPPDRVWRRVRAGRLGELESKSDRGLLEQLDKRVAAQNERLRNWDAFSQHILGKPAAGRTIKAPERAQGKARTGIDLGFGAHSGLYPALLSSQKCSATPVEPPHNDDYAGLLQSFQGELAEVDKPQNERTASLATLLHTLRRAGTKKLPGHGRSESRMVVQDIESDISDIDEHPMVQQPVSTPPSEDSESPTRPRVLLTKKSMTFSVNSYHPDDEPEPQKLLPLKPQRAATSYINQPLPEAVQRVSGKMEGQPSLPIRRRQPSPPIRLPLAAQRPPAPRTPSPDRSPPPPSPPSDTDGPLELISTPQHSIILQPPPLEDDRTTTATSPSQELADQILASMSNASPSPIKRPRHTLSLAERTRLSMARGARGARLRPSHGDSDDDNDGNGDGECHVTEPDALTIRRNTSFVALKTSDKDHGPAQGAEVVTSGDYEDLVARTRKSMIGFEASRQKAQLDRRRSQRKTRQSSLGVGPSAAASSTASSRRDAAANVGGGGGYFPTVEEGEAEDTTVLAEELIAGGQDDAEAIFRSRPKIKMSPIPSPTRELEDD